jgi:hypothetical protein
MKRTNTIILTTNFGAIKNMIKVTIEGVATCKNKECNRNECYLHDGKKVALWASDDIGEVRFIIPEDSSLELLDV